MTKLFYEEERKKAIELLNPIMPITQELEWGTMKGKTKLGLCRRLSDTKCLIKINENITNKDVLLNVIIHEILHSYEDTKYCGHKGRWAERAIEVTQKLGIVITRCGNFDKAPTQEEAMQVVKKVKLYVFKCTSCGKIYKFKKRPRWFKYVDLMRCGKCKCHSIKFLGIEEL